MRLWPYLVAMLTNTLSRKVALNLARGYCSRTDRIWKDAIYMQYAANKTELWSNKQTHLLDETGNPGNAAETGENHVKDSKRGAGLAALGCLHKHSTDVLSAACHHKATAFLLAISLLLKAYRLLVLSNSSHVMNNASFHLLYDQKRKERIP